MTRSNLILGEKPKTVENLSAIGEKFSQANFDSSVSISILFLE